MDCLSDPEKKKRNIFPQKLLSHITLCVVLSTRLVSDGKWCQYSNSSHPFHIVGGIAAFYNRIKIPFKVGTYTSAVTRMWPWNVAWECGLGMWPGNVAWERGLGTWPGNVAKATAVHHVLHYLILFPGNGFFLWPL